MSSKISFFAACVVLNSMSSCYFSSVNEAEDVAAHRGFEIRLIVAGDGHSNEPFYLSALDIADVLADGFERMVDYGVTDYGTLPAVNNLTVIQFDDVDEFLIFCNRTRAFDAEIGGVLACVCTTEWCHSHKNLGENGTIGLRPGRGLDTDTERTLTHELFHLVLSEVDAPFEENHGHTHSGWWDLAL